MDSRKEFSVTISCAAARGENPDIFARSGAAARASAANKYATSTGTKPAGRGASERRRRTSRRRQMSLLQIADGLFQSADQHLNLLRA